jgi:hypothetical protein
MVMTPRKRCAVLAGCGATVGRMIRLRVVAGVRVYRFIDQAIGRREQLIPQT